MTYEILNTCFLVPDIGTTTCAAWAQAWGTVLAIFGASLIGASQLRHARRLESYKRSEVLQALQVLCEEIASTAKAWIAARKINDEESKLRNAARFRIAAKVIEEFPLEQVLVPRAIQALLYARRQVPILLAAMDKPETTIDPSLLHECELSLTHVSEMLQLESNRFGSMARLGLWRAA